MNADERRFESIRVHPRSSTVGFSTPASVNFAKIPTNRHGMVVAQGEDDSFCTNENWGVVDKRRKKKCFGRFL
jgi:hypothetical protein